MKNEDISSRNTISRRIPEIDSLYIYSTRHKSKFTHRHQEGGGYRYKTKGILLYAKEGEIHIYHRTVTIRGVTKGLTMVTKNGKYREVQRWFNEQIIVIDSDNKLFEKFKRATVTPSELGLLYMY